MENNTKQKVEILWTGGFDSTYRIVELSKYDLTIQPYYLSDRRESEKYELNAMKETIDLLNQKPKTKAKFIEPIIIDYSERIEDPIITDAYKRILSKDYFGSQYDWLARFARGGGHPGLELSIHIDDKATRVIQKYGAFKKIDDISTGKSTYIIDAENSDKDIVTLFGMYHFPLVNMTKLEMKDKYIADGYQDIMDKTWFCFTPRNGKPCGTCNPCKYTIEEGMTERFTHSALIRYRLHPIIHNRFTHKIKSIFK